MPPPSPAPAEKLAVGKYGALALGLENRLAEGLQTLGATLGNQLAEVQEGL
eukprot:COSAG05_NODE_13602_length_424_cov_0.624615_1_plen_50_part_01